ncbi:MAG: AAA family ATPase, partial [Candidatus Methanomethylophilaceae archaeon]|nr:AAA family ATPase [Candidatus Methanomethylophilaceae archaeon]
VEEPEPVEEEPVEEPEDDDTPDDYMKPSEYEEVFALISMGFNVFLYGPPGTGKTTMLEHISMKLRGDYELLGCIKDACMDITGYVDAHGQFTTTPVVRAMEKGVPLILDEVDTGNPDEIGAMNSVASHGEVTPKGRERIRAKKGFCIMASGNTNGRGGDFRYPNAVKMNDAFLDRFEFVYVGYDRRIDLTVALGDEKLVDFINEWRDVCISKGLPTFCPSYRVEGAIAKQVKAGMDLEAILIRSFLAKLNVNATQLATILPLMKGRNGYVNTLKTILEKARAGKLVHILGRCN